MAEVKIQLGPPKGGMMGKLGEMAKTAMPEGEDSTEELCGAVYDALKANDREGFIEALCAALAGGYEEEPEEPEED